MELKIEEYICNNLQADAQKVALDFVAYLRKNNFDFIKDNGYWKDKIYYLVKYQDRCVCFISIKDPDEPQNQWTVWADDMSSEILENYPIEQGMKETAWKHVDICGACGSCAGGRHKKIFGRVFENVCGCTFRFDNPDENTLAFMKKMVEIRKFEVY